MKWEYCNDRVLLNHPHWTVEKKMEVLGEEGWEIFFIDRGVNNTGGSHDHITLYCKKPLEVANE